MKTLLSLFGLFLLVSACTWVDVDELGYQVVVISEERAASCKKLGSTTSSVMDNLGPIYRSENKVQEELISLARNEAGAMGGDAIAPASEEWNGSQTFDVYLCG